MMDGGPNGSISDYVKPRKESTGYPLELNAEDRGISKLPGTSVAPLLMQTLERFILWKAEFCYVSENTYEVGVL